MHRALALTVVLAFAGESPAASPTLGGVMPRGGRRGTEVAVTFSGARLADAQDVLCYTPGLTFEKLAAKRFELATSDDTPLLGQDGFVSVVAPADGKYVVMVRETSFRGNPGCHYRLHVGTFPRPTAVLPMGGKPGEEVEFTFLGDPSGPIKKKVKLPAAPDERFPVFAEDAGGISPSPLRVRVGEVLHAF